MPYDVVYPEGSKFGILEQLGTKEKCWVKRDEEDWLLKFGRSGSGENWAEKAAYELARALGIPCARYELAKFGDRAGVVSQTIVPDGGRLVLGNELLARFSPDYDSTHRYSQRRHTVSLVMRYIREAHAGPPSGWHHQGIDACGVFLGYLLLDALIGNTDRHHENWGMLALPRGEIQIAPTFDHASSLGRELNDKEREARLQTKDARFAVEGYVRRARSGFYGAKPTKKTVSCFDAFVAGIKFADNAAKFWRQRLEALQKAQVEEIFAAFPDGWVSDSAAAFAIACVENNRSRILDRLGTIAP